MCGGVAYIDSDGYPRGADGTVHICIGGAAGGANDGGSTPSWAVLLPGLGSDDFIAFMDGNDPEITMPTLPATFAGGGIGGIVSDISLKTGLPEWAIMAAAAVTAVYALNKLVG